MLGATRVAIRRPFAGDVLTWAIGRLGRTMALMLAGVVAAAAEMPAHRATAAEPPISRLPDRQGVSERSTVLADYETRKANAGRDPNAHVRLALWCEAQGLEPERLKHLAIALMADPKHATARGLLGLVAYRGVWQSPAVVAERVRSDAALVAALAEYNARRDGTPFTAGAQMRLALWCEEKGLSAEAVAHLTAVVRLDPAHEAAWTRLGFRKQGGRWVTDRQLAAQRAEAEVQDAADRQWGPRLAQWKSWLRQEPRRDEAERALADVSDPRALRSIWRVFVRGKAANPARAVQLLGQIEAPSSSRALALLAVLSPSSEVRRPATETLARRDPRDAAGLLVGLLRDPQMDPDAILFRYEMRPTGWDGIATPGLVLVRGPRYDVLKVYTVDESFLPRQVGLLPGASASSYPQRVIMQRRQQVDDLVATVRQIAVESEGYVVEARRHVRQVNEVNARIIRVLGAVTGQDRGEDREGWRKWWIEERGYAYEPPAPRPRQDLTALGPKPMSFETFHLSCFGGGTPIHALTGRRQIETIQVGDRVLVQDTRTAALSFQPVVAVHHNKPAATLRIDLGEEAIVATPIHRFWKAGKGWAMARDLRPGDTIRTIGGTAEVMVVGEEEVQPVYNLEVAEGGSFFVGQLGSLVHDGSPVESIPEPFDAPDGSIGRAEGRDPRISQ